MAHAHKHFGAERVVKGETPHASAEMNVTPLIDVLLVLLILLVRRIMLTLRRLLSGQWYREGAAEKPASSGNP